MSEESPKDDGNQRDLELNSPNPSLSTHVLSGNGVDKSLQVFLQDNGQKASRKRLVIDFVIIILTFVLVGLLEKYVDPTTRPFYTTHVDPNTGNPVYTYMGWSDVDILYPHTDNETFPDYSVFILGVFLPIVCFLFFCFGKHRTFPERYYVLVYRIYGLIQTMVLTLLIVEVFKLMMGELRPDFLARCQPSGVPPVCTGDESKIKEGRKSFPSGHSALSFCFMMYLSLILMHELQLFDSLRWRASRSLDDEQFLLASPPVEHGCITGRLLVVLTPLLLASIIAISRVKDNWHHPHDIVWGGIIGSLTSFVVVRAHYYQPFGYHLLSALQRARQNVDKRGN